MATNLPPPSPLSYEGQVVTPCITRNSSPTTANNGFPVPTIWINPSSMQAWILVAKPLGVADWQLIGGGVEEVRSVTVDANTAPGTNPVVPNASNSITVTGGQVAAGTSANVILTDSLAANTYTIQIQRSQAVASSTVGDNGVSHFNSADFTVDSNGFVSAIPAGYTRAVDVDAHTAPGTDPVIPNSSGIISVTGAQIPAGSTSNVIRTDSLADNTYTIEIQRSQSVASSTIDDNGVCHFKNTDLTCDSNGFVSFATQPAVRACVTTTIPNVTGDGTNYIIIFNSTSTDQLSNFNTSTGVFTAPSAGIYYLSAIIGLSGIGADHTSMTARIFAGASVGDEFANIDPHAISPSGIFAASGSIIYPLNANDQAYVQVTVSGSTKTVGVNGNNGYDSTCFFYIAKIV